MPSFFQPTPSLPYSLDANLWIQLPLVPTEMRIQRFWRGLRAVSLPSWVWARCAKHGDVGLTSCEIPWTFCWGAGHHAERRRGMENPAKLQGSLLRFFANLKLQLPTWAGQSHFSGLIWEAWKWNKRADKLLQSVLKIQRVWTLRHWGVVPQVISWLPAGVVFSMWRLLWSILRTDPKVSVFGLSLPRISYVFPAEVWHSSVHRKWIKRPRLEDRKGCRGRYLQATSDEANLRLSRGCSLHPEACAWLWDTADVGPCLGFVAMNTCKFVSFTCHKSTMLTVSSKRWSRSQGQTR